MFISIVMSVLNGEKYLVSALDSVIKQSYKEFEFIIINNGSTDKTALILSEYESKDKRFKIINQDTSSWSEAINKAIFIK